jgi:hypothetical protein
VPGADQDDHDRFFVPELLQRLDGVVPHRGVPDTLSIVHALPIVFVHAGMKAVVIKRGFE